MQVKEHQAYSEPYSVYCILVNKHDAIALFSIACHCIIEKDHFDWLSFQEEMENDPMACKCNNVPVYSCI